MAIILFDPESRRSLLPLSETRAIADIRLGILTQRERWEMMTGQKVYVATVPYLRCLYEAIPPGEHTYIDARAIAHESNVAPILQLPAGGALQQEGKVWAVRTVSGDDDVAMLAAHPDKFSSKEVPVQLLIHPWQIIEWNRDLLIQDFSRITAGRLSEPIPEQVYCTHPENVFIEQGAVLAPCWLNASDGPIYIGAQATILEGSAIRGPFAMCAGSVVKMQSSIYAATTLGPFSTAGGEIKNTLIMGYSNKAHHGYLGDAVIGEWCNLGAGATNSNVKNTAGIVQIWDFHTRQYVPVGQKCGVIMGDYCTIAIQSAMNTGSMYGTCCNVFGTGLLPTILESGSWGVNGTHYQLPKAIASINNWKQLKGKSFTAAEMSVLEHIFAQR